MDSVAAKPARAWHTRAAVVFGIMIFFQLAWMTTYAAPLLGLVRYGSISVLSALAVVLAWVALLVGGTLLILSPKRPTLLFAAACGLWLYGLPAMPNLVRTAGTVLPFVAVGLCMFLNSKRRP